ncbi:unnamed protein product [Pylaiella littoralis]
MICPALDHSSTTAFTGLDDTAVSFSFRFQGKYAEAEALYERCQAIEEKALGPEHPSLATTLHNRAGLLEEQLQFIAGAPSAFLLT